MSSARVGLEEVKPNPSVAPKMICALILLSSSKMRRWLKASFSDLKLWLFMRFRLLELKRKIAGKNLESRSCRKHEPKHPTISFLTFSLSLPLGKAARPTRSESRYDKCQETSGRMLRRQDSGLQCVNRREISSPG